MNNSSSSSSSSYFIDENNNNNYEQQEEEKVLQYLNDYDGHVVAKTPVERLLELKYNKADPLQMVQGLQTGFGTKFNQLKTNNLSPTVAKSHGKKTKERRAKIYERIRVFAATYIGRRETSFTKIERYT